MPFGGLQGSRWIPYNSASHHCKARWRSPRRKEIPEISPDLVPALRKLVEGDTQEDPESPLLWTSKSLNHLADEVTTQGMPMSANTVSRLLAAEGYSMQAIRPGNRPTVAVYCGASPRFPRSRSTRNIRGC